MDSRRSVRPIASLLALLLLAAPVWAKEGKDPERPIPVLTMQRGHVASVNAVDVSADGRFVLSSGQDTILWEYGTAREVRRYYRDVREVRRRDEGVRMLRFGVTRAGFSPDGKYVLALATAQSGPRFDDVFLLDAVTGEEVRRFQAGHGRPVAATFAAGGGQVVAGYRDGTVVFWATESGRETRRMENLQGVLNALEDIAVSEDGKHVVTAGRDGTVRLWRVQDGKEVQRFEGHTGPIRCVAVSPRGDFVLTQGEDGSSVLWDGASGAATRRHDTRTYSQCACCFSPDGTRYLTRTHDGVSVWNLESGEEVSRCRSDAGAVTSAAFSPDGRHVVAGTSGGDVLLYETGDAPPSEASGSPVRRYRWHPGRVAAAAFSLDGRRLLLACDDVQSILVWDLAGGRVVSTLPGHPRFRAVSGGVRSATFSPDGRSVLTTGEDQTARLWAVAEQSEVLRLDLEDDPIECAGFTPGGRDILTGHRSGAIRLWDGGTGRLLLRREAHEKRVVRAAYSPDGRYLLTEGQDGTWRLWETATGKERHRGGGGGGEPRTAFSPDGRFFVAPAPPELKLGLWELETGSLVSTSTRGDFAPTFLPQGMGMLVAGGAYDAVTLWDWGSGRVVRTYSGHQSRPTCVAVSPDGRFVLAGSRDRTARLWDRESGKHLCTLAGFRDGTWAVVDTDGRYDASNGGDVEGLHWVVGNETFSLSQLKERGYDPGLLAKHLGLNHEPLLDVDAFDHVDLFPKVEVAPPSDDGHLRVKLSNRGGGIGRTRVLVNGKEIAADARAKGFDPRIGEATLELDLSSNPLVKPGEENTVEVLAWDEAGEVSSPRGLQLEWTAPGATQRDPPHLWAIVCGVSDYAGEAIDLQYAAKDAEQFAQALQTGAARLFGEGRVHVQVLSTSGAEGTKTPTRTHVLEAFAEARASEPEDIFVVYLSGHGVTQGGSDGEFYYLLAEASSPDLSDAAVRERTTLSSAELVELVKGVPAVRRQVLILDTCASGRMIESLAAAGTVPGGQIRSLDRVKDRTGMFVLTGCAADQVSYEASRFGQGLLTYALLMGMQGAALRDEEYVDVARLLNFASERVPLLARDIGGIQRPLIAMPLGGTSFDVGRLGAEERAAIPVAQPKPVFVRTSFQDERKRKDVLGLEAAVDGVLREAAASKGNPPWVFVDARDMPSAYELVGGYAVKGDVVTVEVTVWKGEEEVARFEVEGTEGDVASLAVKIVEGAVERVR